MESLKHKTQTPLKRLMAAAVFQTRLRTAAVCPASTEVHVLTEAAPSSAAARQGSKAGTVNCVRLCGPPHIFYIHLGSFQENFPNVPVSLY